MAHKESDGKGKLGGARTGGKKAGSGGAGGSHGAAQHSTSVDAATAGAFLEAASGKLLPLVLGLTDMRQNENDGGSFDAIPDLRRR